MTNQGDAAGNVLYTGRPKASFYIVRTTNIYKRQGKEEEYIDLRIVKRKKEWMIERYWRSLSEGLSLLINFDK